MHAFHARMAQKIDFQVIIVPGEELFRFLFGPFQPQRMGDPAHAVEYGRRHAAEQYHSHR